MHVGDDAATVASNRALLRTHLPDEPKWLRQVHGIQVAEGATIREDTTADGAFTRRAGEVLVMMTADCLPILICGDDGAVVGIAHAGWRGLAEGVIEATVAAMAGDAKRLIAYLGPGIGARAYEVGHEVRDAFVLRDPGATTAFTPARAGKFFADLSLLARQRLEKAGIMRVFGGDYCTYTESSRFFSYRRDGATGRMASLIWISNE
jgi:YfiH family protein